MSAVNPAQPAAPTRLDLGLDFINPTVAELDGGGTPEIVLGRYSLGLVVVVPGVVVVLVPSVELASLLEPPLAPA